MIVLIYVPSKNNSKVTLIRREIYIIDNLSTKALIRINIIKPEGIILNTNKDLIIISSYNLLKVPISIIVKDSYTDITVLSKV